MMISPFIFYNNGNNWQKYILQVNFFVIKFTKLGEKMSNLCQIKKFQNRILELINMETYFKTRK